MSLIVCVASVTAGAIGCGRHRADTLDDTVRAYAQLALALGQRDPDYIDTFYGPPAWKAEADRERPSLETIEQRASELLTALWQSDGQEADDARAMRRRALERQLKALVFRARFLAGTRATFDEEMAALFDAVVPRREERDFERPLAHVSSLLPGSGSVAERYAAWLRSFAVPRERVNAVFEAALGACRERTRAHLDLPPSEALSVEYSINRNWNAFTLYEGGFRSRVQVEPSSLAIDRVLELACHEGYPGHHAMNILVDQTLVREHGWMEFAIEPLYGPHAFLMEGAANLAPDLAFSPEERIDLERDHLFPLAGLDPSRAGELAAVRTAVTALAPSIVEGIRRYLDGELDAPRFMMWLERYGLMADQERMFKFVNQYRGYAVAYHEGAALVRAYVEEGEKGQPQPRRRWERFRSLVTSPVVPSDLPHRRN